MDTIEYVEYLCLSCGLQGSRAQDGERAETDDCCPKCGEKLFLITRPQPEEVRLSV